MLWTRLFARATALSVLVAVWASSAAAVIGVNSAATEHGSLPRINRRWLTASSAQQSRSKWELFSPIELSLNIPRGGRDNTVDETETDVDDDDQDGYETEEDADDDDEEDTRTLATTRRAADVTATSTQQQQQRKETVEEIVGVAKRYAMLTFRIVRKVVKVTSRVVIRSVKAGLDEAEEDKTELTTLGRIGKGLQRMVMAILAPPSSETMTSDDDDDVDTTIPEVKVVSTKPKTTKKKKKKAKKKSSKKTKPAAKESATTTEKESESIAETPQEEESPPPSEETEIGEEESKADEDDDDDDDTDDVVQSTQPAVDYGNYLEKAYKVQGATRGALKTPCAVHTGSFSDALTMARSQARLLFIVIPCKKPNGNVQADVDALKSFLSQDVSKMADRQARKSGGSTTGSYLLWSALPGSPEAAQAMKRLSLSSTNAERKKRPIVAAAYAGQAVDSYGRGKLVPKLLAQHHASPPPTPDMMAAWMNALRKRHVKQYAKMQKDLTEIAQYRERTEGYRSSVQQDTSNRKREAQEAAIAQAEAKALEQRKAKVTQRRVTLAAKLPPEDDDDDDDEVDAKTIALRLSDGTSTQRRFAGDTTLETIFNWVDVTLELERETVILTTLNGKNRYTWDGLRDVTLSELGLSKMTAFRVSQKQTTSITATEKQQQQRELLTTPAVD